MRGEVKGVREFRGFVVACEDDQPTPSHFYAEPGGWTELHMAIIFSKDKDAIRRAKRRNVNPTWRIAVFEVWWNNGGGKTWMSRGAEVWPEPDVVDRIASLS